MFTFLKKRVEKDIFAYTNGKIKLLEDVQDEAFSKGLIGPGIAIIPEDGKIVSPVKGEITMLFPTKHALGIKTDDGMEILLHIGIDTVSLKGEGFSVMVEEKQKVKVGDLLVKTDLNLLKEKNIVNDVICIITNSTDDNMQSLQTKETYVKAGEDVILEIKDDK